MSAFYDLLLNQITVCPRCQGYGFLPLPPNVTSPLPCTECSGAGVFLVKPDQILLFSLPTFYDSKKRAKIAFRKKVFAVLSVVLLVLFAFLIKYIYQFLINVKL